MRARYQRGCLTLKQRTGGSDVWEFRWRDESGIQRSKILGTVDEFPSEQDAQRAADASRLEINSELPKAVPITVATLVERYLGDTGEMGRLAFATQKSYASYLRRYVVKRWGDQFLDKVRTSRAVVARSGPSTEVEEAPAGHHARSFRVCRPLGTLTRQPNHASTAGWSQTPGT